MADPRTRREKLAAMAAQSASPFEAEIARRFLAAAEPVSLRECLRRQHRIIGTAIGSSRVSSR